MADLTIREFAELIGVPPHRLVAQLHAAGRTQVGEEDIISDGDRKQLLSYLKRIHGKEEEAEDGAGKARRPVLKRRQVQELSLPSSPREGRGPAGARAGAHPGKKTVKVDVRRSRSAQPSKDEKIEWWRAPFAEHAERLRSVHERVTQLESPSGYITNSIFRDLRNDAQKLSKRFQSREYRDLEQDAKRKKRPGWDALPDDEKDRMLGAIKDFLNEPNGGDDIRNKANEAFLEKEFGRALLPEDAEQLRSIHERIAQLESPPRYITGSIFHGIKDEAQKMIKLFQKRIIDHDLKRKDKNEKSLDILSENEILTLIQKFLRENKDKKSSGTPSGDEYPALTTIQNFLDNSAKIRETANKKFVERELKENQAFFDTVESRPLSEEQRRAVATDDDRNLVVAAAGSGKTSVIAAKTAWLVERGGREPEELHLLTFTNVAANEMRERIASRIGRETADRIAASTVHSLGVRIIAEVEDARPSVSPLANKEEMSDFIGKSLTEFAQDSGYMNRLVRWFESEFAPYHSEHEFENKGQYIEYMRSNDIRTIRAHYEERKARENGQTGVQTFRGKRVKSHEECEIANWLFLHGIEYEYERAYEHKTSKREKSQYKPDFYLPDYNIYIEHFGIDREGRTAEWKGVNAKKYAEDMAWKRRMHEEKGTTLIETFTYDRQEGQLTERLEEKLAEHGVEKHPINESRLIEALKDQILVKPLNDLVSTFIQHYKSAKTTFDALRTHADTTSKGEVGRRHARAFLDLAEPIYERYEQKLEDTNEIDYHDMLERATGYVTSGRWKSPYGYLLVDEFQDLSRAQGRLVNALLNQKREDDPDLRKVQLFAVGDDWQSIFLFGGAEIGLMRDFGHHFGEHERSDLTTTYRFGQRIAGAATEFVVSNPDQIKKTVRSNESTLTGGIKVGFSNGKTRDMLTEVLDWIDKNAQSEPATVLLMDRYDRYEQIRNVLDELRREHPTLFICYKNVHKAKGAEADYSVVLECNSGRMGFPNEKTDDPVLDLVRPQAEQYENAEERRVFYVALTRAKRQCYLLANAGAPSKFVKELIKKDTENVIERFGEEPHTAECSKCSEGQMRLIKSSPKPFYRCSNCENKFNACPECVTGLPTWGPEGVRCSNCARVFEECPETDCSGWIEEKPGRYGDFLGCSKYPECSYTRNLPP